MKQHRGMRPHDIVILSKIAMSPPGWKNFELAQALKISASEVTYSLQRSTISGLLDHSRQQVMRQSLLDFIRFGLPFVFPAVKGPVMAGLPTAWAAPVMKDVISSDELVVWPALSGRVRGESIEPLYPNAVNASVQDAAIYNLLALLDVMRVGRLREKKIAMELLEKLLTPRHA